MSKKILATSVFFGLLFFLSASFPAPAFASVTSLNWASFGSPTTSAELQAITYSPELGLFVAGDFSGAIETSPDGSTWTVQTTISGSIFGAAWSSSLHLFVLTSAQGHIYTSPDGVNWTMRTSGGHLLYSVVWSPELGIFVAVSGNGAIGTQVITSPDGITWTTHTAAANILWNNVTWAASAPNGLGGSGLFVAVAYTGTAANDVMTSPDGVTWTSRTAASAVGWTGVSWSPSLSLFVAVANTGTTSNQIMTSPDGVTWTNQTSPSTSQWDSVTWSPSLNLFVAVGQGGSAGTQVMTSPDGTTWTNRAEAANEEWDVVTWSPALSIFLAVSISGTGNNRVMTSPDGITWTIHAVAPIPSFGWWDVTWAASAPNGLGGSGLFVATSLDDLLMTSPDGVTWTQRTVPANLEFRTVVWSPELSLFVVVGENATEVLTSPDGVTWTARTSGGTIPPNEWYSVVWAASAPNGLGGSGLFVAVAGNNAGVMTSPDGITWTQRTAAANNAWESVVWSPELSLFVAVGFNGNASNDIMTSPDGVTWTSRAVPTDADWFRVTWAASAPNGLGGSGLFVAVSFLGTTGARVATSPDGITWTNRTEASDNEWESVAWSPEFNLFVAVSNDSAGGPQIMVSPDGVTWTSEVASSVNLWNSITWSPELHKFVAVGNSGLYIMNSLVPAAPVISSISSGTPGSTTATITWTTDEGADSQVNYGTTAGYGSSTTLNSSIVTSHSVSLSGLTCATMYHYQVSSTTSGLNTLSSDQTFTTSACASSGGGSSSGLSGGGHGVGELPVTPTGIGGASLDFTINGGTNSYTAPTLTIGLNGDDKTVEGYSISLDPAFAGAGIFPNASSATFTLPGMNSSYTVYVEYFSITGKASAVISHVASYGAGEYTTDFTRTLAPGVHDASVVDLQKFLNTHGFVLTATGGGSPGNETNFYGAFTRIEVSKFQEAHADIILAPLGLTQGTGIFGPATLAFVNAMLPKE